MFCNLQMILQVQIDRFQESIDEWDGTSQFNMFIRRIVLGSRPKIEGKPLNKTYLSRIVLIGIVTLNLSSLFLNSS